MLLAIDNALDYTDDALVRAAANASVVAPSSNVVAPLFLLLP